MVIFITGLLLTAPATLRTARAAHLTQIAAKGKALHPVVISTGASVRMRVLAAELAEYLGRITGARFEVQTGNGAQGIAVGRAEDFPTIKTGVPFDPSNAMRREEYLLRSHQDGIWLLGATEMAVQHAVWDMLYRLGYRQFFPGKFGTFAENRRNCRDFQGLVAFSPIPAPESRTREILQENRRCWCHDTPAPATRSPRAVWTMEPTRLCVLRQS